MLPLLLLGSVDAGVLNSRLIISDDSSPPRDD